MRASPSPAVWTGSRARAKPSWPDWAARWHSSLVSLGVGDDQADRGVLGVGCREPLGRWQRHPDLAVDPAITDGVDRHERGHDHAVMTDAWRRRAHPGERAHAPPTCARGSQHPPPPDRGRPRRRSRRRRRRSRRSRRVAPSRRPPAGRTPPSAATIGTGPAPVGNPAPRSSHHRITPSAADNPKAEPPVSSTASSRSTVRPGSRSESSRLAGAPPRTSADATVPSGRSTTVQPVAAVGSVQCPTRTPSTSVITGP